MRKEMGVERSVVSWGWSPLRGQGKGFGDRYQLVIQEEEQMDISITNRWLAKMRLWVIKGGYIAGRE